MILRPLWLKFYYARGDLAGFRYNPDGRLAGCKFAKGKAVTSQLKRTRPRHFTAVARYPFSPKENGNKIKCTECRNPEKYGPFGECFVAAGGEGIEEGACLNCRYRGEAEYCSLRVGKFCSSAQVGTVILRRLSSTGNGSLLGFGEVKKEHLYTGSRFDFPLSPQQLRNLSPEVLSKATVMLVEEFRRLRERLEIVEPNNLVVEVSSVVDHVPVNGSVLMVDDYLKDI